MNILLACFGGITTGVLAENMIKAAKSQGKDDYVIWAVDDGTIDIELNEKKVDIILLGPQVAYKLKHFQEKYKSYNIPILAIDFNDYGKMDGFSVLEKVEKEIEEKK